MDSINKDIIALDEHEHILLRPEMYVGSVDITEEKIPIIDRTNNLVSQTKEYSVGMYKILDEVLDNAIDEAKRCVALNKPMTEIIITIDSLKNEVMVKDTGQGFKNAHLKNTKTGLTNVETALTILRAGSNFSNQTTEVDLIGTNGVGVSCTNVLSDEFSVVTINDEKIYSQKWKEFKSGNKKIIDKDITSNIDNGTTITFIPRKSIFKTQTWDYDIIFTKLMFRNFLLKYDESLKDINFVATFDGVLMDFNTNFFPSNVLEIKKTKQLKVFVWPWFTDSTSISFVNGSLCTGIHQRMINEIMNDKFFGYDKAHQFYETCIMLNLAPKYVKFGDQNKTKFTTNRQDLVPILKFNITEKEKEWIKQSEWFGEVSDSINETLKKGEISKLKKARKQSTFKISPKFFPSNKKENLFLVEGNCLSPDTMIKTMCDDLILDKKIKDIEVGDVVISHTLDPKTVTDVFITNKEMVILKLKDEDVICSSNHIWLVFNTIIGVFEWIETNQLNKNIHKLVKIL